jgi:hypothetical protein
VYWCTWSQIDLSEGSENRVEAGELQSFSLLYIILLVAFAIQLHRMSSI